jgi:C-terminal processing protease CtpA/Prc
MKNLTLASLTAVALVIAAPAFSVDNSRPQNGSLNYSGNFLTWKDAGHRITLATDGRQVVSVYAIWPDGWMGLHSSDQIARIDGQPVRWVGQLVARLKSRDPRPVVLTVYHRDIDMRINERRDLQFTKADYAKFIPAG